MKYHQGFVTSIVRNNFNFNLFFYGRISLLIKNKVFNTLSDRDYTIQYDKKSVGNNPDVIILKDIPEYLEIQPNTKYRFTKIKQYIGYLMDFNEYHSPEEYMNAQLSSRNRKKLRRHFRKLTSAKQISFKFFTKPMEGEEFEYV